MKSASFIWKGITHYRQAYLGVLAGAAVGATVLLGALMAGDSVKHSLVRTAELRVGKVEKIFVGGERFFRDNLAERVGGNSVLSLQGQVNSGKLAEGQVQIMGIDDGFWTLAPGEADLSLSGDEAAISPPLATALKIEVGDSAVIRLKKPGLLSSDAPLSGESESISVIRIKVAHILSDEQFARFNLSQTQVAPTSVFLPITRIQKELDLSGQANLLLLPKGTEFDPDAITLADYGLSIGKLSEGSEIQSQRIFIEPKIAAQLPGEPNLTYLINTLANSSAEEARETPYSMVTAVSGESASFLPKPPGPDEVVIIDWLAEDLKLEVGDSLSMTYFVVDSGSELVEQTKEFKVIDIIPLQGTEEERSWMPDFPGVADVKSARDWEPGLPLDLTRIRDKDDDYWEKHKGTPKAYISYETGSGIWANRWGTATGFRTSKPVTNKEISPQLNPELAGMKLLPFASEARESAKSPVDFSALFLSMSFFLILAAIALVSMLFRFNVEQRTEEGALLSALGIAPKKIAKWRLGEAFVVVLLGAILGTLLAIGFSTIILKVISSIWGSGTSFDLKLNPSTILIGITTIVLLSLVAVWFTLRRQAKQSASIRLSSGSEEQPASKSKWAFITMVIGGLAILGGIALSFSAGPQAAFFLIGFGVLLLGLGVFKNRLGKIGDLLALSPKGISKINLSRRASRSLTVVGVLAAGVFLVLSVAAFRKNGGEDWQKKESGAGGFAWWVETTSPVSRPADSTGEIAWLGIDNVVPFRVGAGDDIDCFNLTASSNPRLLGTDPKLLNDRFRTEHEWSTLGGDGFPAFVDETTLMWVLKKKVGDTLTYSDEWGNEFEVTIAGVVKDSIFQGSMIVSEEKLLEKFPSLSGYRLFLSDDPDARETLQSAVADLGGKVTSTKDRLAAFHEVENTYIAIFNVLGGLGIILGSVGVGVVTMRNLVERKEEFKTLMVLGVSRSVRERIVKKEILTMIAWGLGIGLLSAIIAVIPVLGGTVEFRDLLWMIGIVAMMALLAYFVGTRPLKSI